MIHDRIPPRDGERIDPDTCPDCFHLFENCVCIPECSSAHPEPNTQQGQTVFLSGKDAQNSFDDRTADTCEWFDTICKAGDGDIAKFSDEIIEDHYGSLPKPPKPLPWLPQEKATDRHPFA